ncbi:hypothetical protein DB346_19670 [Verrucomicrobia bacterium LW23]|nr:hypothetical protein DB346_19670 [Verrucomicrobia bacterium LW23]
MFYTSDSAGVCGITRAAVRTLAVCCLAWGLFPTPVSTLRANPTGGNVVGGSATISNGPNQTTIHQGSQRAVIHWGDFSIRQKETTTFVQPSSKAAVLNRVTGGSVSRLDGNLNANGQVYLVNPNGVTIGRSGRINTGGFTASTLDVSNAEFMKGKDLNFSGKSTAKVINNGKIRAMDGDVTLIARQVENNGSISARRGRVHLAAGTEVLVKSEGTERVFIKPGSEGAKGETGIINRGKINAAVVELKAAGGNEYALAINNSGVIRATGWKKEGGRVYLTSSGGSIVNSGKIRASNRNGSGGEIRVAGGKIRLKAGSELDASGRKGMNGAGGKVLVGGDWQGSGLMEQAVQVTMEKGAIIRANATSMLGGSVMSPGGTVVLWSTGDTVFDGSIEAFGVNGGAGGLVETSGKNLSVGIDAMVNSGGGLWLLDPVTLNVVAGGTGTIGGGGPLVNDPTSTTVSPTTILTALASNNVVLQASSSITITDAINYTGLPTRTLTFQAPTLNLNALVTMANGTALTTATTINVGLGVPGLIQNAINMAPNVGATINLLAGTYNERIAIAKSLTITGAGQNLTTLNGTNGGTTVTVNPSSAQSVVLNDFGITGGRAANGGGVRIANANANVTMNRMLIYGNTATSTSDSFGGGISNAGTLTINQSTIRNNLADATGLAGDSHGGGIANTGTLTIFQSTVRNNTATPNLLGVALGGGVYSSSGTLTVDASTLNNNSAGFGGGIYSQGGTTNVRNSTLAYNFVNALLGTGGGITVNGGSTVIDSSTISGNQSILLGGGLARTGGLLTLRNSIIAGNGGPLSLVGVDLYALAGFTNGGNNMLGVVDGVTDVLVALLQADVNTAFGSALAPLDPRLAPLGWYGGPTQTMAPLRGSLAIDTGGSSLLTTDQRGLTRPQNGIRDKGAVEVQPLGLAPDYVVLNTFDYNPLLPLTRIANSFRLATELAEHGNVVFNIPTTDPGYNSGTQTWHIHAALLTTGWYLDRQMNIDATTQPGWVTNGAPKIVFDADLLGSVFTVHAGFGTPVALRGVGVIDGFNLLGGGINQVTGNVTLDRSWVYNNQATGLDNGGGARFLTGTNTIVDSMFFNNIADGSGGAIANYGSSTLNVLNSTFYNNRARGILLGLGTGFGGAIDNVDAVLNLTNVTLTGNFADVGGAIKNYFGDVTSTNVTMANNTALFTGGSVSTFGDTFIMKNTIVAGSRDFTSVFGWDLYGEYIDRGNNLIGIGNGATGFGATSIVGTAAAPVNPLLAALGNYGGPTLTMALLPGSRAIDGGTTSNLPATPATDQRGVTRNVGAPDIGAYETRGFVYTATSGSNQSTQLLTQFTNPLVVTVTALDPGAPVAGGQVTLTVPSSGASATGTLTQTINASGVASFTVFANNVVGSYNAVVAASPTTVFGLTNTAIPLVILPNLGQFKIYGDADFPLAWTLESGALMAGDTLNGLLAYLGGPNVGNYAITLGTLTSANNPNYTITLSATPRTFEIRQRPLTITPNSGQGKVYGNVDPALLYTVGGSGLVFGDVLTGALSRVAGENVGNYNILQGSLSATSNYAVTFTPNVPFSIAQRPITITPNSGQNKIYGNVDPTLLYTVGGSGLAFSDTFSGALSRAAGENVGPYAINQGTLAVSNSGNYAVSFTSGVNFLINPRAITVTPNSGQTKVYGNVDPTLLYTVGGQGLAFSDTLSGALARAAGENVGNYAINQGSLAASSNYTLTFSPTLVTFGITPRAVTITPDSGQAKFYGNVDPTLTYSVGGDGLAFTDTLSGALGRAPGENVGPYLINQGTLTTGNNSNYTVTFSGTPVNFNINPRSITITPDSGQGKIYGNVDPTLTYSVGGMGLATGDSLSGMLARAMGENVGNYAINQGSLAANSNYSVSFTPGVLFGITPRAITVTPNVGQGKIYGNVDPTLTYTVGGQGMAFSDTLSGSLARAAGENVGPYLINQGSLAANSNYTLTFSSTPVNFNIAQRAITITPNSGQTKIYGDVDPTLTYTVGGQGLAFSDTLSGMLSRAPGENVGPYAINQGNLTAGSNYAVTFTPGVNFGITQRPITVTPDSGQFKIYGNADPNPLTYAVTGPNGVGLVGADTLSGALTRAPGENVGFYGITQGNLAASGNYALTFTPGVNFQIAQRAITITPNSGQTKIYGNVDPTLGYTITSGSLAGMDTLTGQLARAAGENVGNYLINQGNLSGGANYAITFSGTPVTFGITPRTVLITPNAGQGKVYGNVDPTLTYTVGGQGLAFSDTLSGMLSRAPGENVGNYAINQGNLSAGSNYNLQFSPTLVTFGITPRGITITPDSGQGKIYGNVDPTLTYTVGGQGLAGGDTLSGALSRAAGENVGNYAINQGSLAANSNYTVTFSATPVNFGITPRAITVTPNSGQTKIYGNADPMLAYTVGGQGLAFADMLSGMLGRAPGENVGNYAINQGSLSAGGNYTLTFDPAVVNFGITQRAITITPNSGQSKIYGNVDPTLSYSVGGQGLAFADTLSGNLGRAPGENVGNYAINQGTLAANGNYAVTFDPATVNFGITPRSITVTPHDNQGKIYGNVDPTLTYAVGGQGLVAGDSLSGSLVRAPGENVGNYAISQGSLAANANYSLSFVPAGTPFAISPRAITVTPNAGQNKTYGNADPTLTYTVGGQGLAFADTLSGMLGRAPGENVGNYAITQGSIAANANYTLTFDPTVVPFAINPRSLVISPDSGQGKIYGNVDPTLTYTVGGEGLVGGDTLGGSLGRAPGENAGNYGFNTGSLTAGGNYVVTIDGASPLFNITPRSIVINPDGGQSKVYGDADPTLTYMVGGDGLAFNDTLNGSLGYDGGQNVGAHLFNQGTLSVDNPNYNVTMGALPVFFNITPRPITVTPNEGQSKFYGNADPTLTYTVGGRGLVNGDTLTGSLDRAPGENVGTYDIGQGSLAANGNYTLTFSASPVDFSIVPRVLVLLPGAGQGKIYGEVDPTLVYKVGGMGLVGGDTTSGNIGRNPGENAGSYGFDPGNVSAGSNYVVVVDPTGPRFVIDPRPISILPDAGQTKIYGEPDLALTYTVGGMGLVGDDTLSGQLGYTGGQNAGAHVITLGTMANPNNPNYAIDLGAAVLFNIAPRPITVTPDSGQQKTYGNSDPTLTYTVGGMGLAFNDILNGALSYEGGPGVGTYPITQGTLTTSNNPNYSIGFNGGATFMIDPRDVVVFARPGPNGGSPFGRVPFEIGGEGAAPGETLVGTPLWSGDNGSGRIFVTLGSLNDANNPNYDISLGSGGFFDMLSESALSNAFNRLSEFDSTRGRNNLDEDEYRRRLRKGTGKFRISYANKPQRPGGVPMMHTSSFQVFGSWNQIIEKRDER